MNFSVKSEDVMKVILSVKNEDIKMNMSLKMLTTLVADIVEECTYKTITGNCQSQPE